MLHLATLKFLNIIFLHTNVNFILHWSMDVKKESLFSLPDFVTPEAKSSLHNCTQQNGCLNAQCLQPTDSKKPI